MTHHYPQGPASVPANLAAPSKQYKRHAWIAMAMLCVFVALYLALTGWFVFKAYTLFATAFGGGKDAFLGVLLGLPAAFLAVFMVKALFFVRHGKLDKDAELKPEQQPRLFEFLHRLADEAGAPRPHRVYLSPRVNAAVFYDLSVLNLILPSRKNLEIGLGLVNALSLGELKAVLAHEFGHFAQRTMAVGRWVYVAQQIADHIVSRRDALDRFLQGLSRTDLRVAWIGWSLRLVVWSIRSLLEQLFRLVMLAQHALSREMEMQADLVAVSLTGSDALIHALHRAQAADEAWDRTLAFANTELGRGHLTVDLFAVQTRVIERMATLLGDADYGRSPPIPEERAAEHRVFRAELAQPPRMWLTHPLNHEREENAKRVYLRVPLDERTAWDLFEQPDALRREITSGLMPAETEATTRSLEDSLRALDAEFDVESLKPRYRGVYLGRSVVRAAGTAEALCAGAAGGAAADLDALYPAVIGDEIEGLRSLRREVAMLESLRDGRSTALGGVIRHRDRDLRREALPETIIALKAELAAVEQHIADHDRRCRSEHRAAAARIGGGWDAYLAGLLEVLHFSDHNCANLWDAQRFVGNVYAVVTADGKVSAAERQRLITATSELHAPLAVLFRISGQVDLDTALLARLGLTRWADALQEFKLPRADDENLGKWLEAIDGWVNLASHALVNLRDAALDLLLESEARIARACRENETMEPAPAPSRVPATYPTLMPGQERPLQKKLDWWNRFQVADGFAPALARTLVAGVILVAVVGMGGSVGNASITIYNGLATPVSVNIGDNDVDVQPFGTKRVELPVAPLRIEARAPGGQLIESFSETVDAAFGDYVYNVASAGPLLEWTAVYGAHTSRRPERPLGAPRWGTTFADVLFAEPPKTISTKGGGGTRTVLTGYGDVAPDKALAMVVNTLDRARMVQSHARWDSSNSPNVLSWLAAASEFDGADQIVKGRLADHPDDVVNLRAEQDLAGDRRAEVCARHRALAQAAPDKSALQYLAIRCGEDALANDRAYVAGHERWPDDPWLANAAGYVHAGNADWDSAHEAFVSVLRAAPALADHVATDLARIERVRDPDATTPRDALRAASSSLQYLIEAEAYPFYARLHQAKLAEALQEADGGPSSVRVLRLVAASDGADAELVARALALAPDDGFDTGTIGAALGLALRQKADLDAYAKLIDGMGPDRAPALRRFMQLLRAGDSGSAEDQLRGFSPSLRGQAYVIGIVALGERAPDRWRDAARRLLFAPERPYIR